MPSSTSGAEPQIFPPNLEDNLLVARSPPHVTQEELESARQHLRQEMWVMVEECKGVSCRLEQDLHHIGQQVKGLWAEITAAQEASRVGLGHEEGPCCHTSGAVKLLIPGSQQGSLRSESPAKTVHLDDVAHACASWVTVASGDSNPGNLSASFEDQMLRSMFEVTSSSGELAERLDGLERELEATRVVMASDCLSLARGAVKEEHELKTHEWSRSRDDSAHASSPKANRCEILTSLHVSSSFTYRFQETVWDAALFIGFKDIGSVANMLLASAFLANLAVQCLFCWVVSTLPDEFNDFKEETVDFFGIWRSTASESTLTQICSLSEVAPSTDYHAWIALQDASNYSRPMLAFAKDGPVLCTIVLIVWSLNISKVIKTCLDFVWSIHHQCDKDSHELVLHVNLQRISVERVPRHRLVWAYVLGWIQVVISAWLLVVGAQWLVTTTRASDLVLNAVALTYIMEIDELLFATVVPQQVHDIITNLEPITVDTSKTCRVLPKQIPLRTLVRVLVLITFISYVSLGEMQSHSDQVDRLIADMCGQRL